MVTWRGGGRPLKGVGSTLAFLAVGLVPFAFLVFHVVSHWVDVPFADEWGVSLILDRFSQGTLNLQAFFAQHNESRKVFPRLIILGLALVSGYDTRWEMGVSLGCAFLISAAFLPLVWRLPFGRADRLGVYAVCTLLCCSVAQWNTWLTGLQLCVLMPPLMLMTGLLVGGGGAGVAVKTLTAVLCAFVATYSYANGLLLWALLFPAELARGFRHRGRGALLLGYAAAACASVVLYFHGYVRPPDSPPLAECVRNPWRAITFFLAWLGGPLGPEGSRHCHGVVVFLGALVLWAFWAGWVTRGGFRMSAPWGAWARIGLYAVASGAVATLGRAAWGLPGARVSRYTSFSWYAIPAAFVLLHPTSARRRALWALALLPFSVLYAMAVQDSLPVLEAHARGLARARMALQVHRVFADLDAIQFLYPDPRYPIGRFEALTAQGFLRYAPVGPVALTPRTSEQGSCGFLDEFTVHQSGKARFSGWAFLGGTQPVPVVLAWGTPSSAGRAFALAQVCLPRPDVARLLGVPESTPLGFSGAARLPPSAPEGAWVRAWAVDLQRGVPCQLARCFAVTAVATPGEAGHEP